jgi:hypothetical protein
MVHVVKSRGLKYLAELAQTGANWRRLAAACSL